MVVGHDIAVLADDDAGAAALALTAAAEAFVAEEEEASHQRSAYPAKAVERLRQVDALLRRALIAEHRHIRIG